MKYTFGLILVLSLIISACSTTPEEPPTSTPKPSWTPTPVGTIKGCIYLKGELIGGTLTFFDENENIIKAIDIYNAECSNVVLLPGKYSVEARSFKGAECAGPSGCNIKEWQTFEISADEVIELDLEVFPPPN